MSYFKTTDNCNIYYEFHKLQIDAPVIVFLNGTILTTKSWWMQARYLKYKFNILLYDARGQGQSDLGQSNLSLSIHINDLIQLLDYLCVNRIHLVGLSHGARVACSFGTLAPGRINRMVLCGYADWL
ncbi:MAG: alpha/beta fold hydrolase [Desulfobacterales bacterium]|nr:MAG: alpha/beta fold hydrolase [Desulfobacterales bacterium]